jgi:hypothetical protein
LAKGIASRAKDSGANDMEDHVEDYSEVGDFIWDVEVFAKRRKSREVRRLLLSLAMIRWSPTSTDSKSF